MSNLSGFLAAVHNSPGNVRQSFSQTTISVLMNLYQRIPDF